MADILIDRSQHSWAKPMETPRIPAGTTRHLSLGRAVVVVAPSSLHESLTALAGSHGRHVLAAVDAGGLGQIANLGVLDRSELLIHAATFDACRQERPELLWRAREVRLVGTFDEPRSGASIEVEDPWAPTVSLPWAIVRRTLDIVLGVVGLVLAMPVLVVAAAAIRLDTSGSPLFNQVRIGKHGRRFVVRKLRTMHTRNSDREHREYIASLIRGEAAPVNGVFKLVGDKRITRVGSFLRRFSLDELPQLWNVVRGDMSLIGPRPDLSSTMEQCGGYVWLRLRVRPGLTGLWQVSGRCVIPFDEMIELDNRYCAEVGPGLDLAILVQTPSVVLRGTGSA